jgi:hypothetical protein
MHVNTCPICGAQFASLTPGDVCSARCSGEQRRRAAMGKQVPDAEPRYRTGAPDRRGKSKGPGPVPTGKKNCLVNAVALAGGAAAMAAGAGAAVVELIRHLA